MDALNLQVLVNLSGGWGSLLRRGLDTVARSPHPDRMVFFANLDFRGGVGQGFGARAAAQLEQDVAAGAVGLKFFKDFGLSVRDERGRRLPVDHPELDPVFELCARLDIPVLIHAGEPLSFYEPVDRFNERWLELTLLPNRRLPAGRYPRFEEMMAERDRLFARHPRTRFIAAHMGWHANDLGRLGRLLDRYPNVYAETGAILYEPRAAAADRPRVLQRVSGPDPVRQGPLSGRRVPVLLAHLRDGRRVLRLLPTVSRLLEALRDGPARRGAPQGLLRERARGGARHPARPVSPVVTGRRVRRVGASRPASCPPYPSPSTTQPLSARTAAGWGLARHNSPRTRT